MKKPNETNAINALLEILPFVTQCSYKLETYPDELNSQSAEVDWLLSSTSGGGKPLAVEHTVVEAFRGQKTYVRKSYEIVAILNDKCKGRLPNDSCYAMGLPPHLVETLDMKATGSFVEAVFPWTIRTAQNLQEDDYQEYLYLEHQILLLCHGSHAECNGAIGRAPTSPRDSRRLALISLEIAINHGIKKFEKYKSIDYDTLLILENISGAIHSAMLLELTKDEGLCSRISRCIDYIVTFASNEDRMIVGTVWKEKHRIYKTVPYPRRFSARNGSWAPLG